MQVVSNNKNRSKTTQNADHDRTITRNAGDAMEQKSNNFLSSVSPRTNIQPNIAPRYSPAVPHMSLVAARPQYSTDTPH